ncbi:DNA internalization-related competence protein ComEC/Rec2 [Balneolaceae bacterium YR4-1]|uniref:DNA internalization-related competence protein ComEC/Rec2 n=1 Tax=Halalkalibaculum roseum TaxID=2709311 RepID=A0A6M1T6Y9_9BACT|nr:DNA internalization-related competence protein ComEC/Rec2 [Halalkalibaculum roseum]NGP77715.1 DNA internalization-related competence protein ComEC/Rec2 [Halalkalibaculum roseum]
MPGSHTYINNYRFPFAKYPAVRLSLLMIGGILLSHYLAIESYLWACMLGITLAMLFIVQFILIPHFTFRLYHLSVSCYLVSLLLLGAYRYSFQVQREEPFYKQFLDALVWEKVTFNGEVQNMRTTDSGSYQIDVAVDTTISPEAHFLADRYSLRAVLKPEQFISHSKMIKAGNRINFTATIYPLGGKRNPHEFDYKAYLHSQDIFVQAGIDSLYAIYPGTRTFSWNHIRQSALSIIDRNFSSDTAPLAKALLIGYKNELSREEKTSFSRAGLSHIMAVSGLHVGFLLAPFWVIIPFFWTYRFGRQTGLLILVLILFYYAGLTGFSASVTRASITGGFIIYARLFNKLRDSINLTALAALIILLVDPTAIFDIGFQLSFSAVYIILLTLPTINRFLPNRLRYSRLGPLIGIVMVSAVVQAGLFPILSHYFGEFSLIGPLANAVIVPFLGIILPFAVFMLFISIISAPAGFYLILPAEYFLQGLNKFVITLAAWDNSWVQVSSPGPILFLIWAAVIFLLASLSVPALRWKMLIIVLALISVQQITALVKDFRPPKLEVTVLDVGQGDAAVVKTPLGKSILIDAGRWTPGFNSGRYTILPHLKGEGINKLDAVFLSHPHADHIGGILELIEHIPIDTIYNSGYQYDSNLYRSYLTRAAEKYIPVVSVSAGTLISLDPSMRILLYGPEESAEDDDPNERSIILELVYGSTEFLFMGDAGQAQEQRLLEHYGNLLDTDFLKVGHHGSKTSSSDYFLKTASPYFSVVSLDKSNKFKHPHQEAVKRLIESNTTILYTSFEGAVVFSSDGRKVSRSYWE